MIGINCAGVVFTEPFLRIKPSLNEYVSVIHQAVFDSMEGREGGWDGVGILKTTSFKIKKCDL